MKLDQKNLTDLSLRVFCDYQLDISPTNVYLCNISQSRYRPGVAQRVLEVKVPKFHENGTGRW